MKKFITVLVVLLLIGGCAWAYYSFDYLKEIAPNDERIATTDFFDTSGDQVAIMYNYTLQESKGVYRDSMVYLPIDWVKACLNDDFYWDDSAKVLIYTLPNEILYSDFNTKGSDGKPFVIEENGKVCISLSLISSYTGIVTEEFCEDDSKRVFINNIYGDYEVATAARNTLLRTGESIKQRGIVDISKGDKLRILKDGEWVRVYSEKGYTGYINALDINTRKTETLLNTFNEPDYRNIVHDGPVLLAWHQTTNMSSNSFLNDMLANVKGVNVLSPTWFFVTDEEGNCESLVSDDYIANAHGRGMQVWALVDNFTYSFDSTKLLKNMQARKKLIAFLTDQALTHGIDGINVDFEKLKEPASEAWGQFIRELSVSCRNNGLILSVDNPNTANFNLMYRRDIQAKYCDYIINMGYDEHWDGSDAGPVASYPYVEAGLELALQEVPAEKLINGVPFFTRIWDVKGSSTTSQAVGFNEAKEWAAGVEKDPVWKSDLQCYYYENGSQRCWMEDIETLKKKVELCQDLKLAGVACWKLGLENSNAWDVLKGVVPETTAKEAAANEAAANEAAANEAAANED